MKSDRKFQKAVSRKARKV